MQVWRCPLGRNCQISPKSSTRSRSPTSPRWGGNRRQPNRAQVHPRRSVAWAGRALFRSQHGPLASVPFTALPTSRATRMDAQPFRILLCRRLHLELLLTLRTCRCGRQLDMFGHHRAACAEAGVFGRRGYPLEVAAGDLGPRGLQRLGRQKTRGRGRRVDLVPRCPTRN